MKLAQEKVINEVLLRTVSAADVETKGEYIKEWAKKAIIYLQDQFVNRKWFYNLTILALSAFSFGRYVIVLINALLDEAAKEAAKKQV